MKIAVIGGGGIRSMFLAKSLTRASQELGITELVFMDNDSEKLAIFGGLAAEVAKRINDKVEFITTTDALLAVKDADYVITTIRVGQDKMRIVDEQIALKYNVVGQETTGAGGFSMAIRSINALLEYCELIKKYAKKSVKVFNFTNPAGLVSQALRDAGYDFTYGICDAPSGLLRSIAQTIGCSYQDLTSECYGLNHLSYFKSIHLCGRDITAELLNDDRIYRQTDMRYFSKELAQNTGMLLNEYLYYYYYREQAVENMKRAGVTRGETIAHINEELIAELKSYNPSTDFEKCIAIFEHFYDKREKSYMENETGTENGRKSFTFDVYSEDFGGYAGVALSYITAVEGKSTTAREMILCTANRGAIEGLQDSDVIEITCRIDQSGENPKKVENVDPLSLEMIRRVKFYERMGAKAILSKSKSMAVKALMMHPLVNSYETARKLAEEYLEANLEYSGKWND